jgi:hypothetical protein
LTVKAVLARRAQTRPGSGLDRDQMRIAVIGTDGSPI